MRLNVNVIRTLPLLLSLSLFLNNDMHFWIYTMIFGISMVASFFSLRGETYIFWKYYE